MTSRSWSASHLEMSRAEAALARFVLDERIAPSGAMYADNWKTAGYQIQLCGDWYGETRIRSDASTS